MPNTPVLGLPYPTSADTADVPRDIKALCDALDVQQSFLPVGAVFLWPLAAAPAGTNPNGKAAFLIANGQVVAAADYPKLAALLGAPGGNVTVPDLRNKVPLGASGTRPVGATGGEETHKLLAAESGEKGHGHASTFAVGAATIGQTPAWNILIANGSVGWSQFSINAAGTWAWVPIGAGQVGSNTANQFNETSGNHAHPLTGAVTAVGASDAVNAHNIMQPFLSLNFAMRAA